MTRAISIDRWRTALVALFVLTAALVLVATTQPAPAADVMKEDRPMGDEARPVEEGARQERVVVVPEPPHWSGWGDWHPSQHASAPRVHMWVDRGEWSTYYPGDRLWVYFRVDRPCFVTILDYSPDGRVSTIYPSRWSGSTFVGPGRNYRIPESRRYSLRIAGMEGIETLVACAHDAPWPSGPGGAWIPRHHPNGGSVVVGRPGGSPPPGRYGHVAIGPRRWPVPPRWHDQPERWSCASVSFYVGGGGWYDGGHWRDDGRNCDGGYWSDDGYRYNDGDTYNGGWDDGNGYRDPRWDDDRRAILHDRFKMRKCSDGYSRGFDVGPTDGVIEIDCTESSKNDPTEIVGRLSMKNDWGDDVFFRIDVEGDHGERPERGRVYVRQWGSTRVEVEVVGYSMAPTKHWQVPRMKWIEFDVRVFGA
ncbi:DUF4384 domain-containing protein [bacterium]|nr:DUF4384 domain-containing protein [bacterium]